jgi:hypothetical protein
MRRCEDFPCCGHQEPDGSSYCPTDDGIFPCCICGDDLEPGAHSSICGGCQRSPSVMYEQGSPEWYDAMDEETGFYPGGREPEFCEECGAKIDPDDFGCTTCE